MCSRRGQGQQHGEAKTPVERDPIGIKSVPAPKAWLPSVNIPLSLPEEQVNPFCHCDPHVLTTPVAWLSLHLLPRVLQRWAERDTGKLRHLGRTISKAPSRKSSRPQLSLNAADPLPHAPAPIP